MASLPKRTGDKSSTRRLRDYLRANFYLHNIAPGDKLVSHRELSRQLRISPTTALRLYEELGSEGLLDTKERSGTFLKNVGIEANRPRREEEMFRLIRETATKLKSLDVCPSEFSRLFQNYTGAAVRDEFKIGFVAHLEAYELALRTLKKKEIPLSLVRISPDVEDRSAVSVLLAKDRSIRCLMATYLRLELAMSLAQEFDRQVLMARPEEMPAKSFFAPPDGRRRYIIARDQETTEDIRILIQRLFGPGTESQFCIASLRDTDLLREMDAVAEEIIVSPMAHAQAAARFEPHKQLKLMPLNLSNDTIQEMLFNYLFR